MPPTDQNRITLPTVDRELLRRLDVPGPRYTSYPTAPEWKDDFGPDDYAAALAEIGSRPDEALSVYVHIPFCHEMCTYCACNVVVANNSAIADRYLDHLLKEIEMAGKALGHRSATSRIHWGGGTPTFLDERQMRRLADALTTTFEPTADAELAIEVDPAVTSSSQLGLLAELGFRRLSMGVQDFNPEVQKAVNREQSVAETRSALDDARSFGFTSVNFDLIYGLPYQTPASWDETIKQVVEMRPDRLAMYSFAYLPKSRPHQRKIPADAVPGGEEKLELYRVAYERLVNSGYAPIGMDHFALVDDELARAQHDRRLWRDFQGYTVRRSSETIAFGITAISGMSRAFAQNVRSLSAYESAINHGRFATDKGLTLTADDRMRRELITQLMCNFWVDLGDNADERFAGELEQLATFERDGLLTVDGSEVTLTPTGRLFVRNVAMVFDARLERSKSAGVTFSRTI